MGDWGFRISNTGIDVKTGDDKDMVLTSKYATFKGVSSISGGGSIVVPNNGGTQTVTIPHGLSYIPMVQGLFSENNTNFAILPYFNLLGDGISNLLQYQFNIKSDSTNVYLYFTLTELIGPPANYTIYYKHFIFIDKGKL